MSSRKNGCRNGQRMYYVLKVFFENETDEKSIKSLRLTDVVEGVIRVSKYKGDHKKIYIRVASSLSSMKDKKLLCQRRGKRWALDWENPANKRKIAEGGEHRINYKIKDLNEKARRWGW